MTSYKKLLIAILAILFQSFVSYSQDGVFSILENPLEISNLSAGHQKVLKLPNRNEFYVLWSSLEETSPGIFLKKINYRGRVLVDNFRVNVLERNFSFNPNSSRQGKFDADINDEGELVVAWEYYRSEPALVPDDKKIFYIKYNFDLEPLMEEEGRVGTVQLEGQEWVGVEARLDPRVALTNNGEFVVTWVNPDINHDNELIATSFYRVFDSEGAPLSNPTLLRENTAFDTKVSTLSNTRFRVSWVEPGNGNLPSQIAFGDLNIEFDDGSFNHEFMVTQSIEGDFYKFSESSGNEELTFIASLANDYSILTTSIDEETNFTQVKEIEHPQNIWFSTVKTDIGQSEGVLACITRRLNQGVRQGPENPIEILLAERRKINIRAVDIRGNYGNKFFELDANENQAIIDYDISFSENNKLFSVVWKAISHDFPGGKLFFQTYILNERPETIEFFGEEGLLENELEMFCGFFESDESNLEDRIQYQFVDEQPNDNEYFSIQFDELWTLEPLDFEEKRVYTIKVRAVDRANTSSPTHAIEVRINNVNEAPEQINISNNVISENSPTISIVGRLNTEDPDILDWHTYNLIDAFPREGMGFFKISNGSLITRANIEVDRDKLFFVKILSTDRGGLSTSRWIPIRVIDIPDEDQNARQQNSLITSVEVFPNPASHNIHLESTGNREVYIVEVYNSTGYKVKSLKVRSNKLDVENLKEGFYFIKGYDSNGIEVISSSFIKK